MSISPTAVLPTVTQDNRTQPRKLQSAYHAPCRAPLAISLEERIYTATYRYLHVDLGLPETVARDRAQAEVSRKIGKNVCDTDLRALDLAGKLVLDLGCGLGALSAEIASRGARVIAIEPGKAWRQLAAPRLTAAGHGTVLGAIGEELPLASNSVDLIVSLQVLEHVGNPAQVIREAYRVLKPGGSFFFSYENYLSFWEPHYRVRWFPLLPKAVGAFYLRRLGRDPKFLQEAITYTTFPAVRRALKRTGFACTRAENFIAALQSPHKTSSKWKLLKAAAAVHHGSALAILKTHDFFGRTFRTAVTELVHKP